MSDTIIVAIIGAITAILSILGSVFITKLSAKHKKLQKSEHLNKNGIIVFWKHLLRK